MKKLIPLLLMLIVFSVGVFADVCSQDSGDYIFYDHTNDGTGWSVLAGTPVWANGYLTIDTSNEGAYYTLPSPTSDNIIGYTLEFYDTVTGVNGNMAFMSGGTSETTSAGSFFRDDQEINKFCNYDGSNWNCGGTKTTSTWYTLKVVHDLSADTMDMYVDDVLILNDEGFRSNQASLDTLYFKATTSEIMRFRNFSVFVGETCPSVGAGVFIVTAKDTHTGRSLENFSVYMNSTEYSTTNGTLNTPFSASAGYPDVFNIELRSTDLGGYFNVTYANYNISVDLSGETFQTEIRLNAYELISESILEGIFLNETINISAPLYYSAGKYNFTFFNSSYYNKTQEFTVSPLFNGTLNITGISGSILNITVTNGYSGVPLENFTGYAYNIDEGYNVSFNATGTYHEITAINGNYTVYVELDGYAINSNTNYKTVLVENTLTNVTFALYSNNSIRVNIYDETTETLITANITIVLTGNASENSYYTTTGTYFFENLTDGAYTLKFSGANYTVPKTYAVTVADRSTQILNAYLSASYQTVIFTINNYNTGQTIESASFTVARLINSTYTTTESKSSDITGRVQVSYLPNIKYRFTISKTGFNSKVFYLDPVLFSSYTVSLNPIILSSEEVAFQGISITKYPSIFYNDVSNNWTFSISSPEGALSEYGFTLFWPGGNATNNGVLAIGESFEVQLNISGASLLDTVNLTYWYDTTLSTMSTYSINYAIVGGSNVENNTWIFLKKDGVGDLGDFEKALIVLLFVIVASGVAYPLGGETGSVLTGCFVWGIGSYLAFTNLWTILPSLLVGFIYMVGKE